MLILFIGDIIGGIGDVLSAPADLISDIPVLGDIAPYALGAIPGVGPIASAAFGALTGGGAGGAAKGLLSQQLLSNMRQANEDRSRSRELVNQGMDFSRQGLDQALGQFQADMPMRQGFRHGALNFMDSTNPFAQNAAGPWAQQGPIPMAQPQGQQSFAPSVNTQPRHVGGGGMISGVAQQAAMPGSLADRTRDLLQGNRPGQREDRRFQQMRVL